MKTVLYALLCLLLAGAARADEPPPAEEPDLYLEAMRAIGDGRPGDASKLLAQIIAKGPRDAGGWLDLALLQCALGHGNEAEALFTDIEARFAPPPGVRELIRQQRVKGCKSWRNSGLWSLQALRGHDTNVNQGASNPSFELAGDTVVLLPEYLPRADNYTALLGDYMVDLGDDGDLVFGQMHLRHNDREANYNTASASLGGEHPWRAGKWRLHTVAMAGLLSLGGRLYQEQAQLQLRAGPPLPLPPNFDFKLLGGASYTHYRTLSNFDALTLELRGTLSYASDNGWGQASLAALNDRGNDARPGGDRNGTAARLLVHRKLYGKVDAELDWSRAAWRGKASYSPGLIDALRHQATHALRAALVYQVTPEQSVQLEWRRVNNKENISIFQYDAQQLQLSWRWFGR